MAKVLKRPKKEREFWGRLVESAIGAHLINSAKGKQVEIFYWRGGNEEVDFALKKGDKLVEQKPNLFPVFNPLKKPLILIGPYSWKIMVKKLRLF